MGHGQLNLYIAESSEILLAMRRDDEQIKSLIDQFSAIFKTLFGQRLWIRFYRFFPYLCRFLYYSSTNLFNLQTPGEEYIQLIQVSDQRKRIPVHIVQRLCFIIFETFGDDLVERFLKSTNEVLLRKYRDDVNRTAWIKLIYSFIELNGVTTLHKAIFFALHSKYYSVSRRISGISYLSLRPQSNMMISKVLTFIGVSTLLQCVALFLLKTVRERRLKQMSNRNNVRPKSNGDEDEEDENTQHICCVCSARKLPVCTPCGHLFCWPCVVEYSIAESQNSGIGKCPNCRHNFPLNRVVPLMNY